MSRRRLKREQRDRLWSLDPCCRRCGVATVLLCPLRVVQGRLLPGSRLPANAAVMLRGPEGATMLGAELVCDRCHRGLPAIKPAVAVTGREYCPWSGKVMRSLDYAVLSYMAKRSSGDPVRGVYPCPYCEAWHLTRSPHHPQDVAQDWRRGYLGEFHFEVLRVLANELPLARSKHRGAIRRLAAFGLVEVEVTGHKIGRPTITRFGLRLLEAKDGERQPELGHAEDATSCLNQDARRGGVQAAGGPGGGGGAPENSLSPLVQP